MSKTVIIGAGGAARAILFAMIDRGAEEIVIANRTRSRAEALISSFGAKNARAIGLDELAEELKTCNCLINTSAGGMEGKGSLAVDLSNLPSSAFATDIVYTPLLTPFLAAARSKGCTIVDGLGMLLHQAVPGFVQWFGKTPKVTQDLRSMILEDMGQEDLQK